MDPHKTCWLKTLLRHKLLLLEDEVDSIGHVVHDEARLHQRGVESEVPVPVEHGLFDAVVCVRRHLCVGVVHPGADQDRLAGGGRGQRQLALQQIVDLLLLGHGGGGPRGGHHLGNGFGVLPGHPLLQVAVVQVGAVDVRHKVVSEGAEGGGDRSAYAQN